MASSKPVENLCNFDWDDTALINAYNEGLKEREMLKKGKKSSSNKENVDKHQKWWKIGDACRAVYSSDGNYYEAKVTSVDRDRCTVEFVGYGDRETVYARFLKPTAGKKARRLQRRDAGNASVSESGATTTDCEGESQRSETRYEKQDNSPRQTSYNYNAPDPYNCHPSSGHMVLPQQVPSFNHHHGASCCAPPPHPQHVSSNPMLPAPPAPPIPQCPSLANNPSLTAMLVSWYMAGYYTGLHQNQQKDSQCSQRCCGHVNRCCH